MSLLVLLALSASPDRIGIFVGSNAAPPGREPLVHAVADAERMGQVFAEVGGATVISIDGGDLARRTLEAIGRIEEPELFVFYYSGHADDRALLLGDSELPLDELMRALSSVRARVSLHLVDACRSGALTRRKGAKLGQRFSVHSEPTSEGHVVITSSAEWEDSQESDRLGASFFTLHLAAGLRGAADADGDRRVTLSEAYSYVYGRTVESTLATSSGPQHPTFAHDLSGRGDLVLTWIDRGAALLLGSGHYLVVDEKSDRIVAEVEGREGARLALASGNYRVKKRTKSELMSGRVTIAEGQEVHADDVLDERVPHAELVRKGGGPIAAHGVRIGGGIRGSLGDGIDPAPLFRASYELVLPWLSLLPFVSSTTRSRIETPRLTFGTWELGFGLAVSRAFDLPYFTLRGALLLEALRIEQREAEGREATRTGWGSAVAIAGGIESPPLFDFVASLSGEAALYVFRRSDARAAPTGPGEIVARPTYRVLLSVGYGF